MFVALALPVVVAALVRLPSLPMVMAASFVPTAAWLITADAVSAPVRPPLVAAVALSMLVEEASRVLALRPMLMSTWSLPIEVANASPAMAVAPSQTVLARAERFVVAERLIPLTAL